MIWYKTDLKREAWGGYAYIRDYVSECEHWRDIPESAYLAIVGGGPKGFYALEHLLARARSGYLGREVPVVIHWFNPTVDFGTSANFQADQPDYLLTNNHIGDITCAHPNRTTAQGGPILPSLTEWIARNKGSDTAVSPTDYASRSVVGLYLSDMLRQVLAHCPVNVHVRLVVAEVVGIEPHRDAFRTRLQKNGKVFLNNVDYTSILLATGHCYRYHPPVREEELRRLPVDGYLPKAYPVDNLDCIPAGATVGVMGIGLTFIDTLLALTEGRGGVFEKVGDTMQYAPSGREPKLIYPFSRTGLPMLPRGVNPEPGYRLRFLTEEWAQGLMSSRGAADIDFMDVVYPVLAREVQHAYYRTLWEDFVSDAFAVDERIKAVAVTERFTLQRLLFPFGKKKQHQTDSHHRRILEYLDHGLTEAAKGTPRSPLMAAASVWREASAVIGMVYGQGKLTGDSHQFLDQEYLGAFNRIAYGPPRENVEKLAALARAGYVAFAFESLPQISAITPSGAFLLTVGKLSIPIDHLIDARIAKPSVSLNVPPLYHNMLQNGLATPMANGDYKPGCVQLSADGALVDGEGKPSLIYAYGTPTEGYTLDNDSLSRVRHDFGYTWAKRALQILNNKTHYDKQIA